MLNYTTKSRGHYELLGDGFSITVTREKVDNDCLVYGDTWSGSICDFNRNENIFHVFDIESKRKVEELIIEFLNS